MKNLLLFTCLTGAISFSNAQNNTLPATGNVGVGTLTPEMTLHVSGNLKIDSCIMVTDSIMIEKDAHIGQDLKVEGNLIIPNVADIGTNDSKLMVLDAQGVVKSLNKSNLYAEAIDELYKEPCIGKYTTDGTNTYFTAPAWKAEGFVTSPIGFMYTGVGCPAYVGIGIDTPTHELDVRGKCFFSQNVGIGAQPDLDIQLLTSTTKQVGSCVDHHYTGDYGYAYKAIMHNDLTKGIGLYSSVHNKDMFTVYGDGKMVIQNATGTTLQLEASGLLRARQVKVDVDAWPDFVFEDGYVLKSLSEIKEYINIYGHLPDVPSAEVVEAEGMDVEEMNKILLQKVEELTLHLIEQNERIEKLESQLEK